MAFRFFPVIAFLCISGLVNEKVNAQDSVRTDVFVLSTCNPNFFSLIKDLKYNPGKKEYVTKLQVRSNDPSAMKITGINPLRYKYYINNEAITQFMESSPITLAINSFLNGDYLISAPEIKVPEIFKTDSISSKSKTKINEFRRKDKELKDSLEALAFKVEDRWNFIKIHNSIKEKEKINFDVDSIYLKLYYNYDKINSIHDRQIQEYLKYISGLPLNNPTFGILDQYFNQPLSQNSSEMEIDTIRAFQKDFAAHYRKNHDDFKDIDSLLDIIGENQSEKIKIYTGDKKHLNNYDAFAKKSAEKLLK